MRPLAISLFTAAILLLSLTSCQQKSRQRNEDVLVGVIRWDAWNGEAGGQITKSVEQSLSPPEFQWRAPYFVTRLDDYHIRHIADETYHLEQLDFAREAGIDYFAYLYYFDAMAEARKFHASSGYSDVKFCVIAEQKAWNEEVREQLAGDYFLKENYQTVDIKGIERPLIFIFRPNEETAEQVTAFIEGLKADCAEKGINEPYVVMTHYRDRIGLSSDARSLYAWSGTDGEPYDSLAKKTEQLWDRYAANPENSQQVIPLVTAGWDPRPRMSSTNPVNWGKGYSPDLDSWAQNATPEEIAAHLQRAIDWIGENPEHCEANALLIYAWNEHDEGGWLCPTLGEGDSRLEAIAKVLGGGPINAPPPLNFLEAAPLPEAEPGGFILNSSYEKGDLTKGTPHWTSHRGDPERDLQKVWKTYTHGGEQALQVMNRENIESSALQDITKSLAENGQGAYQVAVWARWRSGADNLQIVVRTQDQAGEQLFTTPYREITSDYSRIEGSLNITWTGELKSAEIYVRSNSNASTDLFLDDWFADKVH